MMSEIAHHTSDNVPGEIFCLSSIYPQGTIPDLPDDILAYKATSDPDTMYLHQAMKEPDRKQFLKAMEKEMTDQMDHGNFSIIKRSKVPRNKSILPSVWQMKRKRDIMTRTIC